MTSTPTPQFVTYTFYQADPAWRRLPAADRARHRAEFGAVLAEYGQHLILRTYSLMGTRPDAEMLVWCVSPDLEHLQAFASAVARTALGTHLRTTHAYLAMTRRSMYVDGHVHAGEPAGLREDRTRIRPLDRRYLFVYPFVKTHAWYQLPMAERQRMMEEHFKIGHRYPEVRIHTTYSYGIDDQEFVLGFETDEPARFLELVMELRSAEQRPYTEVDTPIFTCVLRPADEVLEAIG